MNDVRLRSLANIHQQPSRAARYKGYVGDNARTFGVGRVDGTDLAILGRAFGSFIGDWRYSAVADIDGSGSVDGDDLALLAAYFGTGSA